MKILISFALVVSCKLVIAEQQDIERIITTANRSAVILNTIPFTVSAVNNETLNRVAPTHIEEVLRTVAGANFHRGNGQEYLPALRSPVFTGAGACGSILTLENGIPIRAPGFCNVNELFEAHTELASKIEVIKGPGSAHYGSNAVHGVINVITPRPAQKNDFLAVDLRSFGYKRAKWNQAVPIANGALVISASATQDTGYRDDESVDMEKLNLRYDLELDNWHVESGLSFVRLDQETAGFVVGANAFLDRDLSQANANPEAFRNARALRLYSRIRRDWDYGQTLTITPYLRNQAMTFRLHFLPGQPFEFNEQDGLGVLSQYSLPVSPSIRLRAGVDIDSTEGALRQEQFGTTQGSAFLRETVPQGVHYDYAVDALVAAPFIQLEWQHEKGVVQFGVRTEYTHYDYTNFSLDGRTRDDGTECGFGGCRYSRPPSGKNSFTTTSPKLGATYQLANHIEGFANIAFGHRAPQATELYRLQREQQIADLESERIRSLELGFRYNADGLFSQLSAYLLNKDNVIFRDSNFFNISDGETRHKGVELEMSWQINSAFSADLATTYAIHEYANDAFSGAININGNLIDTAPRFVGNTQFSWQVNQDVATNLELHWVSRYFTDPENLNAYEGHELLNWRASWQASDNINIQARILNLLDKRYAERADFTGFSGPRFFPGRPRSYWITIRYSY